MHSAGAEADSERGEKHTGDRAEREITGDFTSRNSLLMMLQERRRGKESDNHEAGVQRGKRSCSYSSLMCYSLSEFVCVCVWVC